MPPHTASVQRRIIDLLLAKPFFIVKKMASRLNGAVQLILMRHFDFRMSLEKIRQGGRASFLRARNNEIQFGGGWPFKFKKHRTR